MAEAVASSSLPLYEGMSGCHVTTESGKQYSMRNNEIDKDYLPFLGIKLKEGRNLKQKDEVVQYKIGDNVTHPKFGDGIVEKINLRSGGVHLHIRFDGEVKCIDQKWLMRRKYT